MPSKSGNLKKEKLEPGDCVAVDQFVVRQGGRLFTTSGREKEEDRFKGGTVFVDMATGKIFVKFQVSLGVEETLVGKACFEREAGVQNQQSRPFSVSERREDTVNVSEGASNAPESSEGASNAPELSEGVQEVPPLPVQVEGPMALEEDRETSECEVHQCHETFCSIGESERAES